MQRIELLSHAKVNWFLRVLDRREDGYHNLETVFAEVELADEFEVEKYGDQATCVLEGFPADIDPRTNLVRRAWQLMQEFYPDTIGGVRVKAVKRIPRGGGLGGGSSNAGAMIRALNALYELRLTAVEMHNIGAKLGSDVPFFISGGCAVGRGRGELIKPIQLDAVYHLVLVFPPHGVSTAEAYRRLDETADRQTPSANLHDVQSALLSGNPYSVAQVIHNDFESVMVRESSFQQTISALDEVGCLRAFLCGSGSTVAGLAKDKSHCVEMSGQLRNILSVAQCSTCTLAGCVTT